MTIKATTVSFPTYPEIASCTIPINHQSRLTHRSRAHRIEEREWRPAE